MNGCAAHFNLDLGIEKVNKGRQSSTSHALGRKAMDTSGMKNSGVVASQETELKKVPSTIEKLNIPPKTPNLQICQSKRRTSTSIMAEEVYEGAIGIDLGEFSIAAQK
jgi:hypothetical protein